MFEGVKKRLKGGATYSQLVEATHEIFYTFIKDEQVVKGLKEISATLGDADLKSKPIYPGGPVVYGKVFSDMTRGWHEKTGTSPDGILYTLGYKKDPSGGWRVVGF